MELPLVIGKLAHLVAELDLKYFFFHGKVMIQFHLKSPLLWASSPSRTEEICCHSCQIYVQR